MLLTIRHDTTYLYDAPIAQGLQRLRLTPRASATQQLVEWSTTVEGAHKQVEFVDQFGNFTELISIEPGATALRVTAAGSVTTNEGAGVTGATVGPVPLWLFLRSTALTTAGSGVASLVEGLDGPTLPLLHELMARVAGAVRYQTGHTTIADTAENVLATGAGVCQDQTHVLIAAARSLSLPARYVSGYLLMPDTDTQDATHAWAEVWVEDLGWVGFDAANSISPDEKYVHIACGLDYQDVSPVSGIRFGPGNEQLQVTLQVQQ